MPKSLALNSHLKKMLNWHIVAPLFIIPLLFSRKLIDPSLSIRYTAFAVYLLLYFIIIITQKKSKCLSISKIKTPLVYSYAIYVTVSFLSLSYAINLSDGIFECFKLFLPFVFLILLLIGVEDVVQFKIRVLKIIPIFGFVIISIGFIQLLKLVLHDQISHQNMYSVSSVFAHKNIFAEVLFLILPFCFGALLYLKGFFKFFAIPVILLDLFLITVLLTRAVWVALFFALLASIVFILLFVLRGKKVSKIVKRGIWIGLFTVALVIAVSMFFYSRTDGVETLKKQTEKIVNFNYGSTKDRIVLWKKTGEIIKEAPLQGIGIAGWKIEILKFGNKDLRSEDLVTFYQRPHNDFLWIWSESGVFALIGYLLIFVFAIIKLISIAKKNNLNDALFAGFMFMLVVGFTIFSLFSFPKERVEHGIFISLAFFFILADGNNTSSEVKKTTLSLKILLAILFVFLVLAPWVGVERMKSENNVRKMFDARSKMYWNDVIEYSSNAESCFYSMDAFSTPIAWYKGAAYYNLGKTEQGTIEYERARQINPYHIYVLNDLASCYFAQDKTSEAINLYLQALNIAPHYQDALFNLTAVYYNVDSLDRAYATFVKIDSSNNQNRYLDFKSVITSKMIDNLLFEVQENILYNQILAIKNNESWQNKVFVNSLESNVDFRTRLLEESIYSLSELDGLISKEEAILLSEKYRKE
jgi:O-antigen ligase